MQWKVPTQTGHWSRVCLARHTEEEATSDGRYFRKGSECTRDISQRYCKMKLETNEIVGGKFLRDLGKMLKSRCG